MQLTRNENLTRYAEYLAKSDTEVEALFSDMLISVTAFFLDKNIFETLNDKVIVPLFDRLEASNGAEIRAWSIGCATGEEAYSLAILLVEEAKRRKLHIPIQVFATDIDEVALTAARHGVYSRTIETVLSEERLRHFFEFDGENWRVRSTLRDLVLFASHSVLKDPPFMNLDIVTCRNLLIYLDRDIQRQVCATMHYALRPNSFLMLGSSETADAAAELYARVDKDARIYVSKPVERHLVTTASTNTYSSLLADTVLAPIDNKAPLSVGAFHLASLEANAPPSVLVGADMHVLHLSSGAGRFLEPSGGPGTLDLPAMVRPGLRLDLKLALHRVLGDGIDTLTLAVNIPFDGAHRRISMLVSTVAVDPGSEPRAMVFFLDGGPTNEPTAADVAIDEDAEPGDIRRLQEELKISQERLAASRLEHDLSGQELRATNEELQSTNEEFRSASEELETSKEELQSMNEELQTLNSELNSKLESIASSNSDLRNLIDATDFGTLFLDSELKIRMFTPRIKDIFNINSEDIGRKITDFTHKLVGGGILDDARSVLKKLTPIEHDVKTTDGRWMTLRVLPYRTADERIEGLVIIFIDVTATRQATKAMRKREERFATLLNATTDVAYRMGPDWTEMRMLHSSAFLADTSNSSADWMATYVPKVDHKRMQAAIDKSIKAKSLFELEHRVYRNDGSIGWTLSRAAPIVEPDGTIREWFGVASDVTARKEGEKAQILLAELNHRVKNMLTVILAIVETTRDGAPTVDDFVDAFQERVHALADAHDALTRNDWTGADLGVLAHNAVGVFSAIDSNRISVTGPPVALGPSATTSLRLALHELSTNAIKHGALSVPGGRIDLNWQIEDAKGSEPPHLILNWSEHDGPTIAVPTHRGFGSRLLQEGLPSELRGTAQLLFKPEGVVYRLEAPLSDQVRHE